MALALAGAGERLLHRVHGEHAEGTGNPGVEGHPGDAGGRFGADVLVVSVSPRLTAPDSHAGVRGRTGAELAPRKLEGSGTSCSCHRAPPGEPVATVTIEGQILETARHKRRNIITVRYAYASRSPGPNAITVDHIL